jgi:hypothetical protein
MSRNEYMVFLDIYHEIRPYLDREIKVAKPDLIKKYPKHKKLVEDVWTCSVDLKLKWPHEMVDRIFEI